mmetsp:Transcript_9434/g.20409  ORF Transcript_9434/g.20409 Transcript_9434/m.20409 type:complete len:248 (+) Transcript_9434:162-905(+)
MRANGAGAIAAAATIERIELVVIVGVVRRDDVIIMTTFLRKTIPGMVIIEEGATRKEIGIMMRNTILRKRMVVAGAAIVIVAPRNTNGAKGVEVEVEVGVGAESAIGGEGENAVVEIGIGAEVEVEVVAENAIEREGTDLAIVEGKINMATVADIAVGEGTIAVAAVVQRTMAIFQDPTKNDPNTFSPPLIIRNPYNNSNISIGLFPTFACVSSPKKYPNITSKRALFKMCYAMVPATTAAVPRQSY